MAAPLLSFVRMGDSRLELQSRLLLDRISTGRVEVSHDHEIQISRLRVCCGRTCLSRHQPFVLSV